VPMGPVVQNASELHNPLELRVYGGKDASFELYEDSGDGYAYEHGARATLQLRWNNHQKTLSIESRLGRFPNMLSKRTLRIVLVTPGHGVGDGAASSVDRTVNYDGRAMKIDLRETK
jgi:alpha-D-xyloside xylohydrolase